MYIKVFFKSASKKVLFFSQPVSTGNKFLCSPYHGLMRNSITNEITATAPLHTFKNDRPEGGSHFPSLLDGRS